MVVALSTDEFNWNEKRKRCYFSYEERKAMLEAIRYVDLVIPEVVKQVVNTNISKKNRAKLALKLKEIKKIFVP